MAITAPPAPAAAERMGAGGGCAECHESTIAPLLGVEVRVSAGGTQG